MEYIVSARKYRPMTFDSVVGQHSLTTTLKNAVTTGKLAHAYLFCGPRGVGKTTCARIFARAINCQTPTADGEACGQCESCRSFEEQRSYNIFELDAASNNSVEDIKTLMEQTRIPPQVGRYKVFIIDEVHMLSTAAFNAFLKTLEEPPAHVVFILATTEKHKLLPTIISRCQIYDFERMNVQNTINHLKMVAQKEGYTYEEEALAVIAEKADGGMRDALSIFDQAASYCQGNITYDKVIEDLNVLDSDNYFRMVDLALENKVSDIMLLLNKVLSRGFDAANVSTGLASHIRNVMMAKDPQTVSLLEVSQQQRDRYVAQAQKCPPVFLYQALRYLNQCDINYRQSSNKRLLVELTLIQVAQITQPDDADAPSAGRSPKRLKSLFRNIVRKAQSSKVASQVATTAPAATKPEVTTSGPQPVSPNTSTPSSSSSSSSTPPLGAGGLTPKLGSLGFTFAGLKKQQEQQKPAEDPADKEDTDNSNVLSSHFTQELLDLQWLAMCNRMQLIPEMKSLASRMKNVQPQIVDFPNIEVLFENSNLMELVMQQQKRILATLRRHLNNQDITVSYRLAEPSEFKPIPTKTEILARLKAENASLSKFATDFNLVLA
ncbi:MAG: DNA polymerase III subunit gamma/tau [Prevotellaceae bacterium]|nr:DNA polymerase III subunit gamma/tau [Prevotellaceae bacterium]